MVARLEPLSWIATAGLLILAGIVGLLAGYWPEMALVLSVGVAFSLLLLSNLPLALALFVAEPLNLTIHGSKVIMLAAILLAVASIAYIATHINTARAAIRQNRPMIALLAGFFTWTTITTVWATDTALAFESVSLYLVSILLVLITFIAIDSPNRVTMAYGIFLAGAVVAVLHSVIGNPTTSDPIEGRLSSDFLDPNQLGATLISATALGAGLLVATRRSKPLQLLVVAAAVLCIAGLFMTGSRGGLVALAVTGATAILVSGKWRPYAITGFAVIAVCAFLYIDLYAPPDIRERILETSPTETTAREGRAPIWQVGWKMATENAVGGVGTGNFSVSSIDYVFSVGPLGDTGEIIDTPKVAHNIYLGWFAELGLPGVLLALSIMGVSLGSYGIAIRRFAKGGDSNSEALARAGVVALVGYLAASFFISLEYNKLMWFLIGIGPAMLVISSSRDARGKFKPQAPG